MPSYKAYTRTVALTVVIAKTYSHQSYVHFSPEYGPATELLTTRADAEMIAEKLTAFVELFGDRYKIQLDMTA